MIAVLQLRVGAVPEGVDVQEVPMVPDRGWQVTRSVDGDIATVRVEHPSGEVHATWAVHLRDPGAVRALENVMQRAGRAAHSLANERTP